MIKTLLGTGKEIDIILDLNCKDCEKISTMIFENFTDAKKQKRNRIAFTIKEDINAHGYTTHHHILPGYKAWKEKI